MSDSNAQVLERVEKTVFISYRRTSVPWALAIYQNLTHHGYDVFFDYEGVGSGDFEQVILGNIRSRAHFLVLLTPSALARINEPADWLRREIETALDSRRNIVPLMLEGFDFGTPSIAEHLINNLAPLKRYNGLPIVASYFEEGMARLRRKHLSVALAAVVHPPSLAAVEAAKHQQAAASTAPPVEERELTAEQWYERGRETKDAGERVRCVTEAIRLNPQHARAFVARAKAKLELGDRTGASEDYDESIRINPEDDFLYWSRAGGREALGDLKGALDDFDHALELAPSDSFNHSSRGHVLRKLGDLEGALGAYTEAIRFDANDAHYFFRGLTRALVNDLDGALSDLDESIRLKPDRIGFARRASVRRKKGDLKGAITDFTRAIELAPHESYFYRWRGHTFNELGDFAAARADYETFLKATGADDPLRDEVEHALQGISSGPAG